MEFLAYHDRSSADHQAHFDDLYPRGWRIITLSVYQPEDPLYAAVWVREAGPDWSAVHGVDAAGYQAAFDRAAAAGYHATILSVAGSSANPVFAGTFEKRDGPIPLTRFGLRSGSVSDVDTIQHWDAEAHEHGWIMTSGAIYGEPDSPRYAGIWPHNLRKLAWSAEGLAESHANYQRRFEIQTSGWARPHLVTLDGPDRYLSIFTDDQVGRWTARHGMTSEAYQAEFDQLVPQGFYPICVQGGGSGPNRRFAVVFATQHQPQSRVWTSRGLGTAASVDAVMRQVIEDAGIRGASLAVVADKRLVFARGYTNAEDGYPIVEPTTPFRIASVTKVFTGIAVHQLIESGNLSLTDKVQDILGITRPDGTPVDPGFSEVTVEDLLAHRSFIRGEFAWAEPETARVFDLFLPVTERQVASYMFSLGLDSTASDYNNFGYQLLGMIVAARRRDTHFVDAIRSSILRPLGMTRTRGATSLVSQALPDEARYHRTDDRFLRLPLARSVMTAHEPWVPDGYGNVHLENGYGTGGLSSAAVDLARLMAGLNADPSPILQRSTLLALFDRASNSGRPRSGYGFDSVTSRRQSYRAEKGGALSTSQTNLWFNLDGLGIAVCYNGNNDPILFKIGWPTIEAAIRNEPWSSTDDFFPSYGMTAL